MGFSLQPRIETLSRKNLIGLRSKMSLINNKTVELWRTFMQRRKEILGSTDSLLYSVQTYDPSYFRNFNPNNEFEKWAVIEVGDFNIIPDGMETVVLPEGLYAVFQHTGAASTGPETFAYIFTKWLPASAYSLDDRPHFERLGEKYRNEDPDSEEEIWIPIKLKLSNELL